jgi:predicted phosphodiesterase
MKYALISDIHANLPALEAVIAHITKQQDVEATYHLGDLVGYAPWPDEVVKLIQSEGIAGVAGNYDSTVGTSYKHCGCRYEDTNQERQSHLSFEWTKHHASDATKQWLRGLPFRIDIRPFGGHTSGPTLTLIHGNQTLNTVYVTEDRSDDFLAKMGTAVGAREHDIIAFGHTHKPWHRVVEGVNYGRGSQLREHRKCRPAQGRQLESRIRSADDQRIRPRRRVSSSGVRHRSGCKGDRGE